MTLPEQPIAPGAVALSEPRPTSDLLAVRVFAIALAGLLIGYMFLGRGFAHVGQPPLYVGELVLLLALIATAIGLARRGLRVSPSPIVVLLVALMVWGAVRTIPYLGQYGLSALRDAVLWGYALFSLVIYVLADRAWVTRAMRLYGAVVPAFALWLPLSLYLFNNLPTAYDPTLPGSNIPLLFFKAPDMAVHTVGAIGFLVLVTGVPASTLSFVVRSMVALPLTWSLLTTSSISRGALAAIASGLTVALGFSGRSRNWLPVLAGAGMLVVVLTVPSAIGQLSKVPSESARPSSSTPPTPPSAREVGVGQLVDNLSSIVGPSAEEGLEGTKLFRLAWWTKIVDYTVFGPYFWQGKGFGVNLADDDGFQPTADRSLRAPHNSHLTFLARTGVPGFVLWLLLQASFGIGLLRSILAHRKVGDTTLAAAGAWILVYWTAMCVNTSFDPYLEGPQGGIWFWTLFGLGLVVMRLKPRVPDLRVGGHIRRKGAVSRS